MDDKGGPYTIWGKPMEVHQNLVASLEDQYDHKGRKWHQDFMFGGKIVGHFSLKSIFPEMHDLVINKHVSVAELWTQH